MQNLGDPVFIRIAEKQASWLSPNFTESLTPLAHRGGIDEGQHLFNIANHQGVEQGFVRILQVAKKAVFAERIRLSSQSF